MRPVTERRPAGSSASPNAVPTEARTPCPASNAGMRDVSTSTFSWCSPPRRHAPAPSGTNVVIVRDITTFVPDGAGAWRRGGEHHENVLVDTSRIPALLAGHGVRASVGTAFGDAELPAGLRSVTGRKN